MSKHDKEVIKALIFKMAVFLMLLGVSSGLS